MLEVVDHRVLERRVEQRREMDRPHHRREHDPGRDRVAEEPHDPRVEDRQDPAVARRRRAQPQDEGDRRGQRQQRRGDQHQQHVLDHVDREQRRVVAADPRQEGERQGQDARRGTRSSGGAGPGSPGGPRSTRRTAHSHQTVTAARPRVGSGSNVQPSSSEAGGRRLDRDGAVGERRRGQRHRGPDGPEPRERPMDPASSGHRPHGRTNRPTMASGARWAERGRSAERSARDVDAPGRMAAA